MFNFRKCDFVSLSMQQSWIIITIPIGSAIIQLNWPIGMTSSSDIFQYFLWTTYFFFLLERNALFLENYDIVVWFDSQVPEKPTYVIIVIMNYFGSLRPKKHDSISNKRKCEHNFFPFFSKMFFFFFSFFSQFDFDMEWWNSKNTLNDIDLNTHQICIHNCN